VPPFILGFFVIYQAMVVRLWIWSLKKILNSSHVPETIVFRNADGNLSRTGGPDPRLDRMLRDERRWNLNFMED
jgi:hypothetical protein